MNSADQQKLDPYVEVRDANGKKLAEDDDGAGDLNSRLVFTAPQSGEYQIVAPPSSIGAGDFRCRSARRISFPRSSSVLIGPRRTLPVHAL